MKRRDFIKWAGLAVAGVASVNGNGIWTQTAVPIVHASETPTVLVVIFQRGAMDGLAAVTPYTDPNIADLRPIC